MSPEASTPERSPADPGLPPVVPPSGKAFLQLIGVPFLIVVGVVVVILLFTGLGKWFLNLGSTDPQAYLRRLDDGNTEVRWRAASDLVQVLLRDNTLASDPDFALELTARLEQARKDGARAEADAAERLPDLPKEEARKVRKELEDHRNLIMFLTACLGNVCVPTGVPELKEMALQRKGAEWQELAERRRRALWALANLGENLKRYDALPEERKDFIEARLEHAVEAGRHAVWARPTLEYLEKRRAGKPDTMGVADALIACAGDREFFAVREMSALAMNFWWGTADEDARMERALVELTHDDGAGEYRLDEARDEYLAKNPDQTRARSKESGFEIRVNANIALARRGSPQVRLDLFETMLEPEGLRKTLVLVKKDGGEVPNEAMVVQTVVHSLKALEVLHKRRPEMDLSALRPAVLDLSASDNASIRSEAETVLVSMKDEG
jgi:hypothetical protein